MNKEEILNTFLLANIPEIITQEEFDDVKKAIKDLQQENQELKRQLEYLRSGEYLNQLRFERDMLQDIVINSEVSKEDKEFIDMIHRNTELLKENQQLKQKYENAVADYELAKKINELIDEVNKLKEE